MNQMKWHPWMASAAWNWLISFLECPEILHPMKAVKCDHHFPPLCSRWCWRYFCGAGFSRVLCCNCMYYSTRYIYVTNFILRWIEWVWYMGTSQSMHCKCYVKCIWLNPLIRIYKFCLAIGYARIAPSLLSYQNVFSLPWEEKVIPGISGAMARWKTTHTGLPRWWCRGIAVGSGRDCVWTSTPSGV